MGVLLGIQEGVFSAAESQESWLKNRKGEYSVIFNVLGNDVEESWQHILYETPGLPDMLQDFFHDGCRCKKRSLKEQHTVRYNGRSTILWEVQCDFDSEWDTREQEEEEQPDPLEWPTTLSCSAHEETVDIVVDPVTGKPIANPNGERIEAKAIQSYPVVEFSRYEAYANNMASVTALIAKIQNYKNRTNSAPFLGQPAGCVFMYAPTFTKESINGGEFFKVTYRFMIKDLQNPWPLQFGINEPFMIRPLCEGYTIREGVGVDMRVISTAEKYGQNIRVNLDSAGRLLQDGADPYFLSFHLYKKADFNELNLY